MSSLARFTSLLPQHKFPAGAVACLNFVAVVVCAQIALAQDVAARGEVEGVWRKVAPISDADETYSRHPLVELLKANPTFGERPWSRNLAAEVRIPHEVTSLEFRFKLIRFVEVEFPTPNGRFEKKLVWYLPYAVRNTGNKPVTFMPRFLLETHETGNVYPDQLLPPVAAQIMQQERSLARGRDLLDCITMGATPIEPVTADADGWVYGYTTWTDIDPNTNRLSVYVEGLTNAYRWDDPQVDNLEAGPKMYTKVLQLNFWRPGDDIDETDKEFRIGVPDNFVVPDPEFYLTGKDFNRTALNASGMAKLQRAVARSKGGDPADSILPVLIQALAEDDFTKNAFPETKEVDLLRQQAVSKALQELGAVQMAVEVIARPSPAELHTFSRNDFEVGSVELTPLAQHKLARLVRRWRGMRHVEPFFPVVVRTSEHDLMDDNERAAAKTLDQQRLAALVGKMTQLGVSDAGSMAVVNTDLDLLQLQAGTDLGPQENDGPRVLPAFFWVYVEPDFLYNGQR